MKKISTKMIITILPVVILALSLLTIFSIRSGKNTINKEIGEKMTAELSAREGQIGEYLNGVSDMATTLANMISISHKSVRMNDFESILGNVIMQNELVTGSGIWFEPFKYNKLEKYMAPYIYKIDGRTVSSYEYSNESYDYFSKDFYIKASEAQEAIFTNPVFDESTGNIRATCVAPILYHDMYLGCVTVDITLDAIVDMVASISTDDGGRAMLVMQDGTYLGGVDTEKIQNGVNILEDENASLAKAGEAILAADEGTSSYKQRGASYNLYYSTLPQTGWKLILEIPEEALNQPVNSLMMTLFVISVIAILACVMVILSQVRILSKGLNRVQRFAGALSKGDYSIDKIKVTTRDELGQMSASLNQMYESNRDMIGRISVRSEEISAASQTLRKSSEALNAEFEQMQKYMGDVNEAMLSTSAATQQVNASTEEVLSNVHLLAGETAGSMKMAQEIRARATGVREDCTRAYESANELTKQFENRLHVSMENAKVVESIGEMAGVISDIADQINLLSLNASIEAARAGDAGRGFAVVAQEIGSLANSTSAAVKQIQDTIGKVNAAFAELTEDAGGMLSFVTDTVTPDYSRFVEVARQYGRDAESIDETSDKISAMADSMKRIMEEVSAAVQNIAEATQNTTQLSATIVDSIHSLAESVSDVAGLSDRQEEIVGDLNEVVGKFVI